MPEMYGNSEHVVLVGDDVNSEHVVLVGDDVAVVPCVPPFTTVVQRAKSSWG